MIRTSGTHAGGARTGIVAALLAACLQAAAPQGALGQSTQDVYIENPARPQGPAFTFPENQYYLGTTADAAGTGPRVADGQGTVHTIPMIGAPLSIGGQYGLGCSQYEPGGSIGAQQTVNYPNGAVVVIHPLAIPSTPDNHAASFTDPAIQGGRTFIIEGGTSYFQSNLPYAYGFLHAAQNAVDAPVGGGIYVTTGPYVAGQAPVVYANHASGALVVYDQDKVLRNVSDTVQEPAFDVQGYRNNAYGYVSPDLMQCQPLTFSFLNFPDGRTLYAPGDDGTVATYTASNDGPANLSRCCYTTNVGDIPNNNGIYVSDGDRYASLKTTPTGRTHASSTLIDAWGGTFVTGNLGSYRDAQGTTPGYTMEAAAAARPYNYPPTSAMLDAVTAEYLADGIDVTKLPSIEVENAQHAFASDLGIPATAEYMTTPCNLPQGGMGCPNLGSVFYGNYSSGPTYGPMPGYRGHPNAVTANANGNPLIWMIDGTGTVLCDPAKIASDPLVARAPHAFNGIYCARMATASGGGVLGSGGQFGDPAVANHGASFNETSKQSGSVNASRPQGTGGINDLTGNGDLTEMPH